MRLPTASELDRASPDACPASCALPAVGTTTPDNLRGRAIHEYLAAARTGDRASALAAIEDEDLRAECAAIDLDSLPAGAEGEVALAWDPDADRAEILRLDDHRAYPDDGRFYGTADLVGVLPGGRVLVADFKSGVLAARASEAMQLRALALYAARAVGADAAEVVMLYLGHDGRWRPDRASFDALDLAEIAEQLRAIRRAVEDARAAFAAGKPLRLHDGPWCVYCPAQRACPARVQLVRTAAAGDLAGLARFDGMESEAIRAEVAAQLALLTPEEAGAAFDRIRLLGKLLEAADGAARDMARALPDGLPLPGGRTLREVAWTTWVKSDVAAEELAALREELIARGEIRRVPTTQVRVTAARKG